MPALTIDFDPDFVTINDSVQVGDIAYYCTQQSSQHHDNFNLQTSKITELGVITEISSEDVLTPRTRLVVTVPGWVANSMPASSSFILFSKDNAINVSTPIGYFAKVKIVNNSRKKSEMFSIACDIFESSK
jgi:hypothetical protein